MIDRLFQLNRNPYLVTLAWAFYVWTCITDWETMRWSVVGLLIGVVLIKLWSLVAYVRYGRRS